MKKILLAIFTLLGSLCVAAQPQLAAKATETEAGKAWDVSVSLDNNGTKNITAFQLDMALPAGFALEETTLQPTSRLSRHSLSAAALAGGKLRIVGYSPSNTAFQGTSGAICTFSLRANGSVGEGVVAEDIPMITDVNQLSSPYTELSEGCLEALLDGDPGSFWHSVWNQGYDDGGTHYLQVEMVDRSVADVVFKFTRRNTDNDHITEWEVRGTNDSDAQREDCEVLTESIVTPYADRFETLTSTPFPTKGYKYLRFYFTNTAGGAGYRRFAHMSEFQLYPVNFKAGKREAYICNIRVSTKDGEEMQLADISYWIEISDDGNGGNQGGGGDEPDIPNDETWSYPVVSDFLGSPVSEQEQYLYNVEAKQFLTMGNSWGTQISLSQRGSNYLLTETDNGWTIWNSDPQMNTGNHRYLFFEGNTGYNDMNGQGHNYFDFVRQDNGFYRIRSVASDSRYGADARGEDYDHLWMGLTRGDYEAGGTALVNEANDDDLVDWAFVTVETYQQWEARYQLFDALNKASQLPEININLKPYILIYNTKTATIEQLKEATEELKDEVYSALLLALLQGATAQDPRDATRLMVNADLNLGAEVGWIAEKNGGNGPRYDNAFSNTSIGGTPGMEMWNPAGLEFNFYQYLHGLPQGYYTLAVDAANSKNGVGPSNGSGRAHLYAELTLANGETVVFKSDAVEPQDEECNEKYAHYECTFELPEGCTQMKVGVANFGGVMEWRWFMADNFTLTYYGTENPNGDENSEWTDVTNLIVNPNFDTNLSGWTTVSGATPTWGGLDNGTNSFGSDENGQCIDPARDIQSGNAEVFHHPFNFCQVLKNMPAGTYSLHCLALERVDNADGVKAVLYAEVADEKQSVPLMNAWDDASPYMYYSTRSNPGDWPDDSFNGELYIPNSMNGANVYFYKGHYSNTLNFVVKEQGDIVIGIKTESYDNWVIFDNFRLEYNGEKFDIDVENFWCEPEDLVLKIGREQKITTHIEPQNATNARITWESSDESVATVDNEGVVTAIAPGTCTVTATCAGISATVSVQVEQGSSPDDVYVDMTDEWLYNPNLDGNVDGWAVAVSGYQNGGYQNASYDNGDTHIQGFIEVWYPSRYLGDGSLHQVVELQQGHYRLQADAIASWQDNQSIPVTGVYLFAQTENGQLFTEPIFTGSGRPEHYELDFTVANAGEVTLGILIENTNANWVAADNFRLSISANDIVRISSISIQSDNSKMLLGEIRQLDAIIEPENATCKRLLWSSSNENVLTVDQNGMVKALSLGSANITATSPDNSKVKATLKLTVAEGTHSPADLVINEVMSRNIDQFVDTSWNYGGWIELYNPTDEPISLYNCYVTDDPQDLKKHQLRDAGVVPAKGYKTLWFDHFSEDLYPQQIDFKLDTDGGWIALVSPSGEQLAAMNYPEGIARTSWARKTGGGSEWSYAAQATPGKSNSAGKFASEQLTAPVVDIEGHLYTKAPTVRVSWPKGSTLRYTTDGSAPTATNGKTSTTGVFRVAELEKWDGQTTLRLCAVQDGYLPSPVVTNSYVRKDHDFSIPVMVISGTDENFFSDEMGMFVRGTNGVLGGPGEVWNTYQDWERPGVFEYFEPETGERLFCQEVGLTPAGGWSRTWGHHTSFKIKASKQYGLNSLDYKFFEEKPYNKHKVLQIRNGGNNSGTRFKDASVQSLVGSSGIYVDYQAYQPVFHYINGRYACVFNMREPNNKHHGYSNYGLDTDLMDQFEYTSHPNSGNWYEQMAGTRDTFDLMIQLSEQSANPAVYKRICDELLDIDEYINYMAVEIWLGCSDWITNSNNVKGYRSTEGDGRFHFVMLDLDGAFSSDNMASNVDGHGSEVAQLWRNLMQNADFRKKFVDTFCLVCGSVFDPERCQEVLDRLYERAEPMMNLSGESAWGDYSDVQNHISGWWNDRVLRNNTQGYWRVSGETRTPVDLSFSANVDNAQFLYNGMEVPTGKFQGRAFLPVTLTAGAIPGYKFEGWKIQEGSILANSTTLFDYNSQWAYYDQGSLDGKNWKALTYNTSGWKTGKGGFGYGSVDSRTTLDYGGDSGNKRPTYYFRREFTLDATPSDNDVFFLDYTIDDGCVIYVNGEEVARDNMPDGAPTYDTFTPSYTGSPERRSVEIPADVMKKGRNIIAVEIHNCNGPSSDIFWDASLTMSCYEEGDEMFVSNDNQLELSANYSGATLVAVYKPASALAVQPVRINEVSAGNDIHVNDYFKKDDWLELYNTTDEDIDVAGMYLSDDAKNPQKFQIPANDVQQTVIPAHDHLVIWASKRNNTGTQIHANFKLGNADGESVTLTSEDGSWSHQLTYKAHSGKESVGLYPDGGNDVYRMHRPTIEKQNTLSFYTQFLYTNTYEHTPAESFALNLNEGWNWISHPLKRSIAIGEISTNAQRIVGQTAETALVDGKWVGELTTLAPENSYKVQMQQDATYTFAGPFRDPQLGITLRRGWNWLGYPLAEGQSIAAALSQFKPTEGDVLVGRSGFATFENGEWNGSLESFKAGEGYLYKSGANKSLTFSPVSASAVAPRFHIQPRTPWTVSDAAYPDVMSIVANIVRDGSDADDCAFSLGAFNQDGECRGIGKYIDGDIFLTVFGLSGENISLCATEAATGIVYDIKEQFTFVSDVLGTRAVPTLLHIGDPNDIIAISGSAEGTSAYYTVGGTFVGNSKNSLGRGLYIRKTTLPDGRVYVNKTLRK